MHCFGLDGVEKETYILSCGLNIVKKRLSFVDHIFHQSDIFSKCKFGEFLESDCDFLFS